MAVDLLTEAGRQQQRLIDQAVAQRQMQTQGSGINPAAVRAQSFAPQQTPTQMETQHRRRGPSNATQAILAGSSPTIGTVLAKTLAAGFAGHKTRKDEKTRESKLAKAIEREREMVAGKESRTIAAGMGDMVPSGMESSLGYANISTADQLAMTDPKAAEKAALDEYRADQKAYSDRMKAATSREKDDASIAKLKAETKEIEKGDLSTADKKLVAEQQERADGRKGFGEGLKTLMEAHQDLDKAGRAKRTAAAGDYEQMAENLALSAGHAVGVETLLGTEAGTAINKMKGQRTLLVSQMAAASGMSSKNWDSDRELQTLLQSLTDESSTYEANISQMGVLYDRYSSELGERPEWLVEAEFDLDPQAREQQAVDLNARFETDPNSLSLEELRRMAEQP